MRDDAGSLADVLGRLERGEWLPSEPWLTVVPAPSPRASAVVCFPGRAVVACDLDEAWIRAQLPDGDLSAALNPPFLRSLEQRLHRRVGCLDTVLMAPTGSGPPPLPLRPVVDADHPRVRRAHRYRDEVRVWFAEDGGVLVVGRGLAGRWEAAIEVDEAHRGRGLGRALAQAARHLVPEDRPIWAQVAPGNASSVRAFLAAGYRPMGAEALLVP